MLNRLYKLIPFVIFLSVCETAINYTKSCAPNEIICRESSGYWCCQIQQYCGKSKNSCLQYPVRKKLNTTVRTTTVTPSRGLPEASEFIFFIIFIICCLCCIKACVRKKRRTPAYQFIAPNQTTDAHYLNGNAPRVTQAVGGNAFGATNGSNAPILLPLNNNEYDTLPQTPLDVGEYDIPPPTPLDIDVNERSPPSYEAATADLPPQYRSEPPTPYTTTEENTEV